MLNPTDVTPTVFSPAADQLQALGVYVTIHGHFYQPPRENPYLNAIEHQPSAQPFHDWNERIYYECYRPNAFARILNDRGEVIGIVNNFEYLSFNIGPTLFSWLERYDLEVYQRIIEADRHSCQRFNGHGNAIAQVYNHMILPLANYRDKLTQIRWGKADFRRRFGREPEGMWLAETAIDYETVAALIEEGIRFTILAPSQAQRCRPILADGESEWIEVSGSQIDPTRPYRCYLPGGDRQRDYLDIFFYDGPISRDMGFSDLLTSSQFLAGRLGQAVRGDHRPSQIIAVATDGETFGHHKYGGEKALAYAFKVEFPQRGWQITNFAYYLSLFPPTWEVELKPVTAWSCAHGVDRWQDNCGCGGGGEWHQRWRRPLREALNWLRDELIEIYETLGSELFQDVWAARDAYIEVIGDRSPETLHRFLAQHQRRPLSQSEQIDALRLLEMQHHALLMFTSCGWFFDELSRPEGVQILRYAARAIELAADVAGVQLEPEFIERLAAAPSNVPQFGDGATVYHQLVKTAQISLQQVAAHYAMSSLFNSYPRQHQLYCYEIEQGDYHLQRMGSLTLAIGQIQLTSTMTTESQLLIFAVLHLGGWDFHCAIQPFQGRREYSQIKTHLLQAFQQGSAARVVMAITERFGGAAYSLDDLFAEERHRLMGVLARETLTRLDQLYTQVYRDNYGILMGFQRDGLSVPQELQVAAAVALTHRAISHLRSLEQDLSDLSDLPLADLQNHLAELMAIAREARLLGCHLSLQEQQRLLEQQISTGLRYLAHHLDSDTLSQLSPLLQDLITIGDALGLNLNLDRAQEQLYTLMGELRQKGTHLSEGDRRHLQTLAIRLKVDPQLLVALSS
ncbi:DUF3536 domain-containing protein [Thermosynechococcus sp. JY1334]|uniref:DUF3536 domain-containing protein n=1 Tax=unclassified Thermosynechococcus TaxID=2622553 RepID=UPI002672A09E|nr:MULTISPECIES: DUF3536 domain-containing protein [unclassified Thermosynechococcus]MDR7898074.1 DUF3536 domain-containing protein [Thermosynechococcus sp. JY1332]MDR7905475.1 DUF3536 domain-containing protein [Thermosynechococcus sp. JY1334]WKT85205.1 DUF3536 domain-containing protein [Thermosynechococcus sp. JY1339]WNC54147.1 DUF3536 domain-containing protein [Thermosynechococcus sp. JY1331]